MDLSVPFHLFSWVVGDVNGRPFISYLYPKGALNNHSPSCLLPHSEQQPAEILPTIIEVVWPVTAGLGVRGLRKSVVSSVRQIDLGAFSKHPSQKSHFRSSICD
ncbi:hypothetical protein AVEN_187153-1 [Araneus ventricosus]|uniref:Uncharacterized protein n=1 Tax=Araneus ventricosus TaxID=182803 RepID=A0A4Y2LXW4_ARAVE|nr:hypothetical protein AVEN_187153-1 [Araneus ventricosus]